MGPGTDQYLASKPDLLEMFGKESGSTEFSIQRQEPEHEAESKPHFHTLLLKLSTSTPCPYSADEHVTTLQSLGKQSKTSGTWQRKSKELPSSHQVMTAMAGNPFLSWEGCYVQRSHESRRGRVVGDGVLSSAKDCQHRHHFKSMTRMTLRIQHFCFAVLYRNAFQKGSPMILALLSG